MKERTNTQKWAIGHEISTFRYGIKIKLHQFMNVCCLKLKDEQLCAFWLLNEIIRTNIAEVIVDNLSISKVQGNFMQMNAWNSMHAFHEYTHFCLLNHRSVRYFKSIGPKIMVNCHLFASTIRQYVWPSIYWTIQRIGLKFQRNDSNN